MKNFIPLFFALAALSPLHSHAVEKEDKALTHQLFIIEPQAGSFDPNQTLVQSLQSSLPLEDLKQAAVQSLFPLISNLQSSFLFSDEVRKGGLEQILLRVLTELNKTFLVVLKSLEGKLPESPAEFSFAFVPWEVPSVDQLYGDLGITLSGYKLGGDYFGKPPYFDQRVLEATKKIQAEAFALGESAPFYLLSSTTRVSLSKSKSLVKMQIAIGLNGREVPFEQTSPEIKISHVVIPDAPNADPSLSTVMLVDVEQEVVENAVPQVKVHFGPLGTFGEVEPLTFSLLPPPEGKGKLFSCPPRHQAAPYLKGILDEGADPKFGKIIKGMAADIHIYDLVLDLIKAQATEIDLFIGAGFQFGESRLTLGCINQQKVDDKFKTEVNNQIASQLATIQKQAKDKLISVLLGGQPQ